jgi:hypothetical protein
MATLRAATLPCLSVPFGQRTWTHVLAVLGSERDAAVSRAAAAFAALWNEEPVAARFAATMAAVGREGTQAEPNENPSTGVAVNQLLKLVRDDEHNVLVVDAAAAQVLIERAPCAVLTVPVSTV